MEDQYIESDSGDFADSWEVADGKGSVGFFGLFRVMAARLSE